MSRDFRNNTPLEEAYLILREKLDSMSYSLKISPTEAEDFLQDGFIRLCGQPIDNKEEAKGKLWVTIKNLAVDSFRRKKKNNICEEVKNIYVDPPYEDSENILKQFKALLSPLQNEIMTLLIKEDMDYEDIAKKLNMKEGAIRTNVSRARKILKEKLER